MKAILMKRKLLSVSVAAAVMSAGSPVPVQAQDGGPVLQEIVVTAQRREEALQDTPVTVTSITGDALEVQNLRELTDLQDVTPGLQYQQQVGRRTAFRMRGISTTDASPAGENPTALHVDGIYFPTRSGMGGHFFDVSRIEVLQGPQGTLYGRNTSAGSINIITNRPTQEFAGSGEFEVGSYRTMRTQGMVNIPITDSLAIRAAFQTHRRDGYYESGLGDLEQQFGRVSAQWQINNRASLFLKGDYGYDGTTGGGTSVYGTIESNIVGGQAVAVDGDPSTPVLDPVLTRNGGDPFNDRIFHPENRHPGDSVHIAGGGAQTWGLMGEFTYSFDPADLIVNASLREQDNKWTNPIISEAAYETFGQRAGAENVLCVAVNGCLQPKDTSAEGQLIPPGETYNQVDLKPLLTYIVDARLQGVGFNETLDWTAGVFYFEHYVRNRFQDWDYITNQQLTSFEIEYLKSTSNAVYGQVTWSPIPRLSLTLGGRYTEDVKDWNFKINVPLTIQNDLFNDVTWDSTDYRVGVSYDFSEDLMLYFNNSTGFRAGSFFPGAFAFYNPEEVTAYELGFKSTYLDNRLQVNANAYYWDYEGLTQNFNAVFWGPDMTFDTADDDDQPTVGNANLVDITGWDIQMNYAASENDLVSATLEYNDAVFDEFDTDSLLGRLGTGYRIESFDWSGLQLPNAPEWRWNVGWNHTFNFANGGTLDVRPEIRWEDGRWMDYEESLPYTYPGLYQEDYYKFDVDARYQPPGANWHISAYVHNITDEAMWTSRGTTDIEDPRVPAPQGIYITGSLQPPRTFGIRVGAEF